MTTTEKRMKNKHVVLQINVMEHAENKLNNKKKIHTYIHTYIFKGTQNTEFDVF
jgi:hypothetical protein